MSVPASAEAEISAKSNSVFIWPNTLWKKSVSVIWLEGRAGFDGRIDGLTLTWKSGPLIRKSSLKVAGSRFSGRVDVSV
jgi:hypothetical protein